MIATTTGAEAEPSGCWTGRRWLAMQRLVRRMPIGDQLIDLILRLVRAGRPENRDLPGDRRAGGLGPGPARQPGADAGRARPGAARRPAGPLGRGRDGAARPVLRHRMAVSFAARAEGITVDDVVGRLCRHVAWRRRRHRPLRHRERARLRQAARPSASASPRSWSRPTGSRPPSHPACTAGGAPAWARRSGSSASTRRAMPPARSTGASRPARATCSSASRSGKRPRASGSGATSRARWRSARRPKLP